MGKVEGFKRFVRQWIRDLREPETPEIEVQDTIWGRAEAVVCTSLITFLYISWPSLVIAHELIRARQDAVILGMIGGYLFGFLLSALILLVLVATAALIIRIGDFVVRGNYSDGFEDWFGETGMFIGSAVSRPISWTKAIIGHGIELRRFRRETQAYLNAKLKAESVLSDLNRPDAEDLFSGIEDEKMLEGLLRQ